MGRRVLFVKRWHVCASLVMHSTALGSPRGTPFSKLQSKSQGETGNEEVRAQRSQLAVAVSVDATSKLHYDYPKLAASVPAICPK